MTVKAMTTNHPTCCADCSHYRGDPSYDCALVNRSMLNAETKRPFWCPLVDAFFKMPGIDRRHVRPSEAAYSWIAENIDVLEALAAGTWKAVPVEPTDDMARPLMRSWLLAEQEPTAEDMHLARQYAAIMLAAAPAKPEDE